MTKEIISSRDLHLYYRKREALKRTDLSFNQKGIITMIDLPDCEKSTHLRPLDRVNNLIPDVAITGNVLYKDRDIYGPKTDIAELREEIGMVFQQPNPFPLSVYENVICELKLKGEKDKRILDQVVEKNLKTASVWDDMKDRSHGSALSLSDRWQRRVYIARILTANPEIILLGEPMSALDPVSTGKIENMLLELGE